MGTIDPLVVAGGLVAGFGFPVVGIVVHWFVSSVFRDRTERPDSTPPVHGRG